MSVCRVRSVCRCLQGHCNLTANCASLNTSRRQLRISSRYNAAVESDDRRSTSGHTYKLRSRSNDSLHEAQLELQAWIASREDRVERLKKLQAQHADRSLPSATIVNDGTSRVPPEASAGPITLNVFRQQYHSVRLAETKKARTILAAQLLRCTTAKDMLQVLVIAMTHPKGTGGYPLSLMEQYIVRAWYRCRGKESDKKVLRTIIQFIGRFEMAKLPVHITIYGLAVKFAARCRDVEMMRRCLRKFKNQATTMQDRLFRAIVAKCSVGRAERGAIRNGRWKPEDLRQVLLGFHAEAHLPEHERCHLDTFVNRSSIQYIYGWIAALALARAKDKVWEEWEFMKRSDLARRSKRLMKGEHNIDIRIPGDYLFVEAMQITQDHDSAWTVFRTTGLGFDDGLKTWLLLDLIRHADLAGPAAPRLQTFLLSAFGDEILPSGLPLATLCTLDWTDPNGNPVMSKANAQIVSQHLQERLTDDDADTRRVESCGSRLEGGAS